VSKGRVLRVIRWFPPRSGGLAEKEKSEKGIQIEGGMRSSQRSSINTRGREMKGEGRRK